VPLPAGPTVCAFLRGNAEVLVVVRLVEGGVPSLVLPEEACGEWRSSLDGATRELDRVVPFDDVLGPLGIGLLERVG
jgi:hypothetical protein